MDFWSIVTILATLFGCTSLIPEVLKALKSRHLRDVSKGTIWLLLTCSSLWGIYGISKNETPLIISAFFNITMEIILLILKKTYDEKRPHLFPSKKYYAQNNLLKKNPIPSITAKNVL